MKILVVSHEYPPVGGGGANACEYITQAFALKGHKVTIVTAWFQGQADHEEVNGVEIYRIHSKREKMGHCNFSEMLRFIVKALPFSSKLEREKQFDICQIFFGIPSGPIGYYLKKKYELPYIIRFGGGDIPGFQDRFALLYKVLEPVIKVIWNNASALIANSQGLKDFALQFYAKKEIEIIPNGVDTEKFFPIERKQVNDKIDLLFVSRLIERKGIQFVIPKLKAIEEKTGKKIHLTIVGDGPYKGILQQITNENDVDSIVSFEGQKSKKELVKYYQNSDVFILPSKREGMPNVVLEAMACGLPIVMTPCEGSAELVSTNGIIANGDFADAIIEMINSKDIKMLGAESRRLAEDVFGWKNVADKYEFSIRNLKNSQYK
ncbi:MAG: glycosyltransferase family 4 protein [Lachnospiraceae bacterium]|nr:glycosyltransferase family 4 protein [Lachnospiraceae bacterium]